MEDLNRGAPPFPRSLREGGDVDVLTSNQGDKTSQLKPVSPPDLMKPR